MGAGGLSISGVGGVAAHIGLWKIEDQPPAAHVGGSEPELVAEERAKGLGLGRVEHCVNAADH